MGQKKSFKADINPALQYLSTPEGAEREPAPQGTGTEAEPMQAITPRRGKPPEGYKLNPLYIEKRSKRVQILLQPSLYAELKAAAEAQNISINEFIHTLLEDTLRGGRE